MKASSVFLVSCLIVISVDFSSCKKELLQDSGTSVVVNAAQKNDAPVWRAYKDSFDTYYIVVPDFANGAGPGTNFLPAWFPGGGKGNATHIGKAYSYFNQYTSFGPGGITSVPAPVTMFFATELVAAGITNIPDYVNSVTFDKQGNAVWFQGGQTTTIPVSPTRINFSGTNTIVGGTGKFVDAPGSVDLSGYFNPQDPTDASFYTNGKIAF